jgi:hypothetical protein
MAVNAAPKYVDLFVARQAAGASQPIDISSYSNTTLYFRTNGIPGAGTILIEESAWPSGAATWSLIDTVLATSDIGTDSVYAYHVGGPGGAYAYKYIRARISVAVTTATLDVALVAV